MDEKQNEQQVELEVCGMTCDSSVLHVNRALQGVEGVLQADMPEWVLDRATVKASAGIKDKELRDAVKNAGYMSRLYRYKFVYKRVKSHPNLRRKWRR